MLSWKRSAVWDTAFGAFELMSMVSLEDVFSSMMEGIVVVDQRRRITALNTPAALLFGRTGVEVAHRAFTNKSLIDFLRTSDLDALAERVLQEEIPLEEVITLYQPSPIHVQVHGTVLHGTGDAVTGALLVLNDVTRLKRLENMRRDFVANVSHELRTPITSILGFLETLVDDPPEDRDVQNRFLSIARDQANRLNLIIEDLLSLSRLESWEGDLPTEECSLLNLISRTIAICQAQAAAQNISIQDVYIGSATVLVNEPLLEQALVNLVNNAVKYSHSDSTVEIRSDHRGGVVHISVKDEGPGIPPLDRERIFERFYRVDRARSRALGGTGLGLAIVKHIALAHGGEVSVDSVEGRGSTFTISLPQRSR